MWIKYVVCLHTVCVWFDAVGPELMQATKNEDTKQENKDDSNWGMASKWEQRNRLRLLNKLALLGSREYKRDL